MMRQPRCNKPALYCVQKNGFRVCREHWQVLADVPDSDTYDNLTVWVDLRFDGPLTGRCDYPQARNLLTS